MNYVFSDFVLDTQLRELRHAGVPLALQPRVFHVLAYLVERRDRLVTREEFIAHLWPGQFVDESAVARCIMAARKALGDRQDIPQYIKTFCSHGYRFVAPVVERPEAPPGTALPPALPLAGPFPTPAAMVPHPPLLQQRMPVTTASAQAWRCGVCQQVHGLDAVFCMACGTRLGESCPQCGQTVRPHATFCPACGLRLEQQSSTRPTPVVPLSAATATRQPEPLTEGERKQTSVLCCTLVYTPGLASGRGVERLSELVQAVYELALPEVQRYEGTIDPVAGHSFTALFGVPVAHEDHAQRAVLAAVGLQRRFEAHRATLGLTADETLTLSMGIHTGPAVVSRLTDDPQSPRTVVGMLLELAQQLAHQAEAGTILLSEPTALLVQGMARMEAVGLLSVEGQARPFQVYQLHHLTSRSTSLATRLARARSRFVGREGELAILHQRLEQVERGQGQVVGIIGEPGIGKSRLLYEFRRKVQTHEVRYLEGRCQSYSRAVPYLPIVDLLRAACGLRDTDGVEDITARLSSSLHTLGIEPQGMVPYFFQLLGLPDWPAQLAALSPQTIKAHTFEALHRLFLSMARQRPLILVVEDLHWIDATSEEYLAALVERLTGAPLLLLVTTRPGYRPPWMDKSYAMQLALQPLAAHDSRQVLRSVLGRTRLASYRLQQILAKAEGNPFFLEELARTVAEQETAAMTLTIPDTVQDVLAARIDRLPPEAKRLLKAAAVIGKDVPVPLLEAIAELPEEALQRHLRHLQAVEFLYEAGVFPERVYSFKHALTQEVAYQSLLTRTRRRYHRRIAQVLEAKFPETREAQPEHLAHHYTEAGLVAQALPYWLQAGTRASQRSANVEAISHLTRGLELLKTVLETPERAQQELVLQTTLAPVLMATKDPADPDVERVYARARELCQQVGSTPELSRALWGLWYFYNVRVAHQTARELGEQLFGLAQEFHDAASLLTAHRMLGTTLHWQGEFAAARAHLEQGRALYDPSQHRSLALLYGQDPGVACRSVGAMVFWCLGYPDHALQWNQEALALARELAHPYSLAYALYGAARFHYVCREARATPPLVEALMALAGEQGFPYYWAQAILLHGWALAAQGQSGEGRALLRQGLTALRPASVDSYHLALLAEAYGNLEQPAEGLQMVAQALVMVDKTGERWWEAELHRLRGELLLQSTVGRMGPGMPAPAREAEACFHQALDVARRQGAKSLELRAAMSLSRLWQRQGRKAEAREPLAEIYSWFTEGFDTADLQEAKALLAALS